MTNRLGSHFSEEWKQHLSEAHLGKKRSKESCEKQSQTITNKPHPHKSHNHTSESKQKLREAQLGKEKSELHKSKLSAAHIGMEAVWMRGEKHPNWNGGSSSLPYCKRWTKRLKESIRERDNYICQLCNVVQNGHKHAIHHIHYDKSNCYPDLITLCSNCHSKVNFNRDYYENLFMNKLNEKKQLSWISANLSGD